MPTDPKDPMKYSPVDPWITDFLNKEDVKVEQAKPKEPEPAPVVDPVPTKVEEKAPEAAPAKVEEKAPEATPAAEPAPAAPAAEAPAAPEAK